MPDYYFGHDGLWAGPLVFSLLVVASAPEMDVYLKIPVAGACPCRSQGFSLLVVAGQFGPAMLVYLKIVAKPLYRHPRSLLIGDLSPNTEALPTQGKDARLLPRA